MWVIFQLSVLDIVYAVNLIKNSLPSPNLPFPLGFIVSTIDPHISQYHFLFFFSPVFSCLMKDRKCDHQNVNKEQRTMINYNTKIPNGIKQKYIFKKNSFPRAFRPTHSSKDWIHSYDGAFMCMYTNTHTYCLNLDLYMQNAQTWIDVLQDRFWTKSLNQD